MIDIKEGKIFNFNTVVEGQGFGFAIAAATREEACQSLLHKLSAIIEELQTEISSVKSKKAN